MDTIEQCLNEPPSRASRFPDTPWSIVLAASAHSEQAGVALAELCAAYRQPIYRWLRQQEHDHHEADEAAQDFVASLTLRQRLPHVSPQGPRFRVWLLTCLRNHLGDRRDAVLAAKRGGGVPHLLLEDAVVTTRDGLPEREFDRRFAAAVHERVLSTVSALWQEAVEQERFAALRPFILAAPDAGDYEAVGRRLGLAPAQIKRMVFRLRAHYFSAFRSEVSRMVVPEELAAEMRHLVALLADLPGA